MISTQVAANQRHLPCDVSVQRHGWGEPVAWAPDLVVGSDVTYDATLELRGPLALLDPLLGLVFNRIGD